MSFLEAYQCCALCPRDCKTDRTHGKTGFCGESADCRVSFIGAHFGEEPSLTGSRGSGTLFFSGCSSQCFFCQNHQISTGHEGRIVTSEKFLSEVHNLIKQGVHNLNFVTPDHFWPHIKELCVRLREEGLKIPKVFNSSGYQKPEMVEEYARWMDVFLPDLKFVEPDLAKVCMEDERYPGIALEAIRRMVKAKGFLEPWDTEGKQVGERGVLVRHLVLPGHVENSLKTLRLLRQEFGSGIPLSVMSQYQPVPGCAAKDPFQRTLRPQEYRQVLDLVEELGFEKVYTQELTAETAFLPDFKDPHEPFPGNRDRK